MATVAGAWLTTLAIVIIEPEPAHTEHPANEEPGDTTSEAFPLPGDREKHQLPVRAVNYLRIQGLLGWGVVALAATAGAVLWTGLVPFIRFGVPSALWLITLASGFIEPIIRYRRFWYAISPDEIDFQHGWFVVTRTVVPMNRVQHLTVSQGPLATRFNLAKVSVHTAAGEVTMEPLDHSEAEHLRSRIAALAGLSDDV